MRKVELGTPVVLGNMLLVPILGDDLCLKVIPLDEGLSQGAFVEEVGYINRVVVKNPLEDPLFIMDGEELIGALQDRIAVYSAVVEGNKEEPLEVVCVEKGRWEGEERQFHTGFSAFPKLRMTLTFEGVTRVSQDKVWKLVENKLTTLRVSSATMSLHHSFTAREQELELYTKWDPPEDCVGVMAFSNRGFLCCDIFGSQRIFKSLKDKLLKGYALDALEDRIKGKSFKLDLNQVQRIWKDIQQSKAISSNRVVGCKQEILASSKVKGKRSLYMEKSLHETFFPSK